MSKLDERRKLYEIPDVPYLPMAKNVLVFRIPLQRSAGGLHLPETHSDPNPFGVLVAAGLKARDIMREHLIEVGDVVWFGRFEGWEKEVDRERATAGKYLLQLKIDGVLGSVDAKERAAKMDIAFDDTEGEHYYVNRKKGTRNAA